MGHHPGASNNMPHDPETISNETATLSTLLVKAGLIAEGQQLEPLSGGRTNRLWRTRVATSREAGQSAGDLVVKLFAQTPDNPLFSNDPKAEALMLDHLAGTGLAPQLHARLTTPLGPVLLYSHVAGSAWHSDPAPVARTLVRLHQQPVPSGLAPAPNGSAALRAQTFAILERCPDGPDKTRLRDLEPQGSVAHKSTAAVLHGDVVPGNIIQALDGSVTLIDWQCPALGDPVHDLAVFLSPAMQLVYRGKPLSPAEQDQFLGAYGDAKTQDRYLALAPWFHWRMAAYCLWRGAQGAPDYTAAFTLECAGIPR